MIRFRNIYLSVLLFAAVFCPATIGQQTKLRPELLAPKAVEPISAAEFRQLLAQYKGKVVLVNLWATWCAPCLKELPELAKLQEQYRDKGLQVLTVTIDEADILETRVKKVWRERAAGLPAYLETEATPDKFVSALDPTWAEIMPTNFVLDRAGKLQKTLTGGKTLAEFEAAVKPLL